MTPLPYGALLISVPVLLLLLISGGVLSQILGVQAWGHLCPSVDPLFFSSPVQTPQGVWEEPAHPLPNILMQFISQTAL